MAKLEFIEGHCWDPNYGDSMHLRGGNSFNIYRERERERQKYIYIYIYIYFFFFFLLHSGKGSRFFALRVHTFSEGDKTLCVEGMYSKRKDFALLFFSEGMQNNYERDTLPIYLMKVY